MEKQVDQLARLYSVRQIAKQTGLPVTQIRSAVREGSLAGIRLPKGSTVFLRVSDVEAWVASHKVPLGEPLRTVAEWTGVARQRPDPGVRT